MISVVIPTYNDEHLIAKTITALRQNAYTRLLKEIIVVDGGSSDHTVTEAEKAGAIVVHGIRKNRSSLLNLGAEHSTGKILYFLSPGSIPPKYFTNDIVRATQKGYSLGSFTVKFDYRHWGLKFLKTVSGLRKNYARLEDQSLFVIRELFVKAGAFREDYLIMEDQEMIGRLRRYSSFVTLKEVIITPAQKYLTNGIVRSAMSYLVTWVMYLLGYPQQKLVSVYQRILGKRKSASAHESLPQVSLQ